MDRGCGNFGDLFNSSLPSCCNREGDQRDMAQKNYAKMPARPSAVVSPQQRSGPPAYTDNSRTPPPRSGVKLAFSPGGSVPQSQPMGSLALSKEEMCGILARSRICQVHPDPGGLPRPRLLEILNRMRHIKTAEGRYVVRQGDVAKSMIFVLSGQVSVDVSGRPVATLSKGDFFGESALCTSAFFPRPGDGPPSTRSADCRALTAVELIELDAEALRPLSEGIPELKANMEAVVENNPKRG